MGTRENFGFGFWVLAWGLSGSAIFLSGADLLEWPCPAIWILITVVWIGVSLHEQYFSENARGHRRARLTTRRLCVECGYDLRATDNRCPECGHELAASKARVEALENLAGPPVADRLEVVDDEPEETPSPEK